MKKKYMLVINCRSEDEVYIFDCIKDFLDFWEVDSIDELLSKSSPIARYTVFEISKEWSRENGKCEKYTIL